jgi:hypothetical protein
MTTISKNPINWLLASPGIVILLFCGYSVFALLWNFEIIAALFMVAVAYLGLVFAGHFLIVDLYKTKD